ncbi:MAG: hypothetical protein II912_02925 [Clostridia bacterium]|nr:hypothetical protein [Clostridia bacterium]
MNSRRTKPGTMLFVALILLGGILHSNDPDQYYFAASIIYCAEYLIYAGLILFWQQSLNERLLPTRAKGYLLTAGWLMLLFLAAQFTKYRIAIIPGLTRYCWYIYYLPILLVPTLFLMTCFCLGVGANRRRPYELLFLLPAGLLTLGVLTNDLHRMAFIPKASIENLIGRQNTYTHGFLYYAACAWAGFAMVAGIVFLLIACRRSGSWKKAILPLCVLAVTPMLFTVCNRIPKNSIPITFEWPEICIFSLLSVFEACVRGRLIPSNENHPGFFSQMDLSALITDRSLKPAFVTQSPVQATDEQLRSSLTDSVYPTADTRLYGMEIRAGYAFWTEDESALNRLNEELRDANETLEQENELLERERELIREQTAIEERSHLYQKAAQEVYPTQKKISEILEKTQPGTYSFHPDIARALALMAYVKRKANFVLVAAERETVTANELAAALKESAHYLCYCGMNTVADIRTEKAFPCQKAMAVYDCFEAVCEELLGITSDVFVRLQDRELMIMADAEELPAQVEGINLPVLPLPLCRSCEDGQLVLRFDLGGEAA